MGWFGRKKNAEGLYFGDAPVTAPGMDGASPSAYDRAQRTAAIAPVHPEHEHEQHVTAALDDELQAQAEAQLRAQAARVHRRKSGKGAVWIGSAIIIGIIVTAVMVAGDFWFGGGSDSASEQSVPSLVGSGGGNVADDAAHDDPPADESADSETSHLALDVNGARLDFVVWIGALHGHGTWAGSSPTLTPTLVVQVDIKRLDQGSDPVVLGEWNWRVETGRGTIAWPTPVSAVSPNLTNQQLTAGATTTGYLTFLVDSADVTLALTEGRSGEDIATWDFTAWQPEVIDAAFDDPITPEIGHAPFAVAVTGARLTGSTDPATDNASDTPSGSGGYLTFDVTIEADGAIERTGGHISASNFVFVTKSGSVLESVADLADGALSRLDLLPGAHAEATISFETDDAAGTLELRTDAGETVVRWPTAVD